MAPGWKPYQTTVIWSKGIHVHGDKDMVFTKFGSKLPGKCEVMLLQDLHY